MPSRTLPQKLILMPLVFVAEPSPGLPTAPSIAEATGENP
jgi:hypothetical protein